MFFPYNKWASSFLTLVYVSVPTSPLSPFRMWYIYIYFNKKKDWVNTLFPAVQMPLCLWWKGCPVYLKGFWFYMENIHKWQFPWEKKDIFKRFVHLWITYYLWHSTYLDGYDIHVDSFSLCIVYQRYTSELGSANLAPAEQQIGAKNHIHMCSSLGNAIRHCVVNMWLFK